MKKERVGEILRKQTRVPQNIDRVERNDRGHYSVESTRSDVQFIDEVLNLPASVRMEFSDKDLFRLQAIQGRNLSHLLINDRKFGGDSSEMELVKTCLEELEKEIAEGKWDLSDVEHDNLSVVYERAIAACQAYCDKKDPSFEKGMERKKMVQATLDRLKEESRQFMVAKEVLKNKTPEERKELHIENFSIQDLLVYGKEYLAKYDDPLEQFETKEATGIQALTWEDFAAVIGTYNRGEVEFKNGRLNIIRNSYLRQTAAAQFVEPLFSTTKKTVENRRMRERLYELVKEKLGDRNPQVLETMRVMLYITDDARKAVPISRRALSYAFTYAAIQCSDVARALAQGNTSKEKGLSGEELKQRHVQHRLAMVSKETFDIDLEMNDSLFLENEEKLKEQLSEAEDKTDEQKEKKEKLRANLKRVQEQKAQQRDKINEILKKGKLLGVPVTSLSQHQMDNLVNGGLVLVRDQVFSVLKRVYQCASNLNGGMGADFNMLAAQTKTIDRIAALVLTQYATTSDTRKELVQFELEELIKESAFSLAGQSKQQREGQKKEKPSLEEVYDKMHIGQLAAGAEGIEYAVARRLPECKAWKHKKESVRKGADRLKELCENMKKYSELQALALIEGLSEAETEKLISLGGRIDMQVKGDIPDKGSEDELALVATELKGTRFANGYAQAKKLIDQQFSFEGAAKELAAATKCQKVEKQEQQVKIVPQDTEEKLQKLDKDARKVADVMLLTLNPASLIKSSGDKNVKDLIKLREELRKFPARQVYMKDVRIGDISARMVQKADGSLHVGVNGQALPLTRDAYQMAELIDNDIMENSRMYGAEQAKQLIDGLDISGKNAGAQMRARILLVKFLAAQTGKPETFYTNITLKSLKEHAQDLATGTKSAKEVINYVNRVDTADYINGQETRELLKMGAEQEELEPQVVIRQPEQVHKEEDVPDWGKEQKQVQILITEMIFSQDTWNMDDTMEEPEKRLQNVLLEHPDTLLLLLDKPELIDEMLRNLPFPEVSEQEKGTEKDIRAQISAKLKEFLELDGIQALRMLATVMDMKTLLESDEVREMMREALDSAESKEKLKDLDQSINDSVSMSMEKIQDMITDMANRLFSGKSDDAQQTKEEEFKNPREAGIGKKERARRMKVSREKLQSILDNAAKGAEGQGLFIKNVLQNYFYVENEDVRTHVIDQRAMLASALRNSKPIPQLPKDATEAQKEHARRVGMGNFLGGFLKGAGPLLQKMLQGMPDGSMPVELSGALKDMKSNLAPIPDRIVKAQLQSMIDRSNRKITKIEVTRALGAASVGQAFLCKMYGPGMPESGTDIVVKLLRPNVRNRMLREKKVMLYCAKLTDGTFDLDKNEPKKKKVGKKEEEIIGGMEATYIGQLSRIEEELDLTIEAKNAKKGSVYDEGYKNVKAMKVNNLVEPTTNALVLERAPGTTVDKYLEETREKQQKLVSQFYVKDQNGNPQMEEDGETPQLLITDSNVNQVVQTRTQLTEMLEQAQKRQTYLIQLSKLWVNEGIYGSGFYHGDLHAGNIMVDDSGLTVIDFGNATKLTNEQQGHVTRMMMAACGGDVEVFRHGFHELLANTPEDKYQEKRAELTRVFEEVFRLGDKSSAGVRIAAALLKAQTLGIELPPAIFNFSQCQIRLQNTIDDMNKQIDLLQKNIQRVDRMLMKENQSQDLFQQFQLQISEDARRALKEDNEQKRLPDETKLAQRYAEKRMLITDITVEQVHGQLRDQSKEARKNFTKKYFKQIEAVDAVILLEAEVLKLKNLKQVTKPEDYPKRLAAKKYSLRSTAKPLYDDVYKRNIDEFDKMMKKIDDCIDHLHEEGAELRLKEI